MVILISCQYIFKEKYQRLVEVKFLIISMIQKLGYICLFKFWIRIPLTDVNYDNFSGL